MPRTSSQDSELSLEGLVESAALGYVRDCADLPDKVTLWTEHGADDGGPDDAPEEDRGTPGVVFSASRGEENFTNPSGVYTVSLSITLRATDEQLPKRDFSRAWSAINGAVDAASSQGLDADTESLHVYSLENREGEEVEFDDLVREQSVSIDVYCTSQIDPSTGGARLVTTDGAYLVTTDF